MAMNETLKRSVIPRRAPFSQGQREWLSGLFSENLLNKQQEQAASDADDELALIDLDEAPWHDMDMPLSKRMALAEDEPFKHRLMAAMAQQDCGQCGYDCKGYAGVLAQGQETDMSLCVPGGTTTRKQVKALFAEHGPVEPAGEAAADIGPVGYDRRNPWSAPVKSVIGLHGEGAPKDTRHVVIDLTDSGIEYQPGDSLGVYARNELELIAPVIVALNADPEMMVKVKGDTEVSLKEALTDWRDITVPSDESLEMLAQIATDGEERALLLGLAQEGVDESGKDLLDILRDFPSARPSIQELIDTLGALKPRLYSIASSQRAHPSEVHLTVSVVQYESLGRQRKGVASNFLADRATEHPVPIYLQPAKHFAVQADDIPIIMVGPGTGIAPFRAFLEERHARGAAGGAWLFFGNPHSHCDFLYQAELEGYLASGTLTRLSTAFSRDQADKIYVQDRIREQGAELWKWLERGACFYVCGDAEHMAPAVEQALRDVVQSHGDYEESAASDYINELVRKERYLRDVY